MTTMDLTNTTNLIPKIPAVERVRPAASVRLYEEAKKQHYSPKADPKNEEQVQAAISDLNKALDQFDVQREFTVEKDINRVVIKLKSKDNGEVIKQIPSQKAVDLAKNLKHMVGLLFDEVA